MLNVSLLRFHLMSSILMNFETLCQQELCTAMMRVANELET